MGPFKLPLLPLSVSESVVFQYSPQPSGPCLAHQVPPISDANVACAIRCLAFPQFP